MSAAEEINVCVVGTGVGWAAKPYCYYKTFFIFSKILDGDS